MNVLPYNLHRVAEVLLGRLREAVAGRGRAALAIPGGRSPGPVLGVLAGLLPEAVRRHLYLFWVDERAVPPGHRDRNDAAALAAWEEGGPLPAYIRPMPAGDGDLERAAADYAGTLQRATGGRPLDACLLGVGEDGHIASLFPDHPALEREGPVVAVYDSPKPPPRRLTLSLPVIGRAALRVVLAPGEKKGAVRRRAAAGPDPSLPVSLLPPENTVWFVDQP
ncbi:MAG: 6-phosphogluconolactonase [PVC group bacterium]